MFSGGAVLLAKMSSYNSTLEKHFIAKTTHLNQIGVVHLEYTAVREKTRVFKDEGSLLSVIIGPKCPFRG